MGRKLLIEGDVEEGDVGGGTARHQPAPDVRTVGSGPTERRSPARDELPLTPPELPPAELLERLAILSEQSMKLHDGLYAISTGSRAPEGLAASLRAASIAAARNLGPEAGGRSAAAWISAIAEEAAQCRADLCTVLAELARWEVIRDAELEVALAAGPGPAGAGAGHREQVRRPTPLSSLLGHDG